jgi:hypothetical protein
VGILAAAAAVLLSFPSIRSGWYLDDLVHRAQFLEVGPMTDSANMTQRMYDFLSGVPEEILAYKDLGFLPWWADDRIKIRFWRPLSSFTHVIDYELWPDSAALMHLHSVFWLFCLVLAVASLYRRLIALPMAAGLASLLYALDDAHGMPVAFLANRNAIVAACFGVLSVSLHDRFRRDRWMPGALLSPAAFLAALLGGESGIGIAPYLLAYSIFLERRSGGARFATLVPHALIGIAWLLFYKSAGYGTSGSAFYLDPVAEPAEWFRESLIRAPLLLLGQWFLPPSSFAFLWTPAQTLGIACFGVVFLTFLFFLLLPILRVDAAARFFLCGMLLAVVPITAGFPHDRLLFFVGIGAMGLLSMLLVRLFDRSVTSGAGRLFGWVLVVVHVAFAAPFQVLMNTAVRSQEPIYSNPPRSLPDDPGLERQRLVVVNQPSAFYGQYIIAVRVFDGKPAPRSVLMLAPGTTSLVLERSSEDTLTIAAENGWIGSAFDNVYRNATKPFPENYTVTLSDVRIQVVETTLDGRPEKARFVFARGLEDASLRWVLYDDGRYVPFELPAVGERRAIAAVPFSLTP